MKFDPALPQCSRWVLHFDTVWGIPVVDVDGNPAWGSTGQMSEQQLEMEKQRKWCPEHGGSFAEGGAKCRPQGGDRDD